MDSISKTSYQRDHNVHIFTPQDFSLRQLEWIWLFILFTSVWLLHVLKGVPVKTLLSVWICAASCVGIVYFVCMCAPTAICVLTGPGDMEQQWPRTYWAAKGENPLGPESTWIQPPSDTVLNCHCSAVFSVVDNWQSTIFTEMVGTRALSHFLYIRTHLHLILGASHWSHTCILIIRKLCLQSGASSGMHLKWNFGLGLNPYMLLPHYPIVCCLRSKTLDAQNETMWGLHFWFCLRKSHL